MYIGMQYTVGTSFPSFPPARHKLVIPPYAHYRWSAIAAAKNKKKIKTDRASGAATAVYVVHAYTGLVHAYYRRVKKKK